MVGARNDGLADWVRYARAFAGGAGLVVARNHGLGDLVRYARAFTGWAGSIEMGLDGLAPGRRVGCARIGRLAGSKERGGGGTRMAARLRRLALRASPSGLRS